MFDGMNGWKAQGALGGALAGFAAPYEVTQADQRNQAGELELLIRRMQAEQQQKNIPLEDARRERDMFGVQDELGAWKSGQQGELKNLERQGQIGEQKGKLSTQALDQAYQKAEWYVMADNFIKGAKSPTDLTGEGWTQLRDHGKAIGLNLPDQLDQASLAKISGTANMAIERIPQIQRMRQQAAQQAHQTALQGNQFSHERTLQDDRQSFQGEQNSLDRTNRLQIAQNQLNAAQAKADDPIEAIKRKISQGGIESLTPGEADNMLMDYRLKLDQRLNSRPDVRLAQAQLMHSDPAKREAAQQFLDNVYTEEIGEQYVKLTRQARKGSRSNASPQNPSEKAVVDAYKQADPKKPFNMKVNPEGYVEVPDIKDAEMLPKGTKIQLPNGRRGVVK